MARIFIDGFESGDTKLWDVIGTPTIQTGQTGMDGYSVFCESDEGLTKSLPAKSEYYAAFRWTPVDHHNLFFVWLITFYNGGTRLGSLRLHQPEMVLKFYRGAALDFVATGTRAIALASNYLIEVRYKPHASAGIIQVKIDGILDIEFEGNTGTETPINKIKLHGNSIATTKYDNVIMDDAAWPGNTKIQAIRPTGAGASSHSAWAADTVIALNEVRKPTAYNGFEYECTARGGDYKTAAVTEPTWPTTVATEVVDDQLTWTCRVGAWSPSTGDNYACVEEVPASETDYVKVNAIGNIDTYAAGNLVGTVGSVKCVQVQALAISEGAPTPTRLQLVARSGAVDYFSADILVPATSATLANIWETDPATAAPWTEGGVNAMEIGVKAVA